MGCECVMCVLCECVMCWCVLQVAFFGGFCLSYDTAPSVSGGPWFFSGNIWFSNSLLCQLSFFFH